MFLYILLTLLIISTFVSHAMLFGFLQINAYELHAKAKSDDKRAKKLYPLHKQGYNVLALLVLGSIILHIALIATIIAALPVIAVILISPFILLLSSFVLPIMYAEKIGMYVLARKADSLFKIVSYSSAVTKPLSKFIENRFDIHTPRLLGSKQELYKLLEKHTESPDSAIAEHEIELVRHSLDFSIKKVKDHMTPRRVVKRIAANDEVGPILIDELHKSGHSRFPVYDDKNIDSFIGVLFLRDLVDVRGGGEVRKYMKPIVNYIHEEESLYYALRVILHTNQQLLVVVNTFEEFIGVISIEDVIEQIIGAEIVDEFDAYDDLRAVAAKMAEKEAKKHATTRPVNDEAE